ncbi:MAG TPA: rhodanese-like domain-containing protein [Nevskiaceae bacterium]|nr:rhodanese-like domain-containing protein [Nevskiaceae bacterium]
MRNLSPGDIAADVTAGKLPLIDVRTAEELAIVRLPQARHIPMDQIPARLADLNPQQPVAILCHHGGRSLQVAHYLERNGFADVINVAGGIDAWADLDPTLPRY